MTAALSPVYPTPVGIEVGSVRAGLNLRDWFAGQVLAGIARGDVINPAIRKGVAEWAYAMADAMIVAREPAVAPPSDWQSERQDMLGLLRTLVAEPYYTEEFIDACDAVDERYGKAAA